LKIIACEEIEALDRFGFALANLAATSEMGWVWVTPTLIHYIISKIHVGCMVTVSILLCTFQLLLPPNHIYTLCFLSLTRLIYSRFFKVALLSIYTIPLTSSGSSVYGL
jgi:hypothetical protein